MFEHFKEDLLSIEKFILRLARFYLIATALLLLSLVPGIVGFIWIGGLDAKSALINTLSVLGTIDPPHPLNTESGQIFTAIYGLFAETIFLLALGILVAPILHRIFHKFNINTEK